MHDVISASVFPSLLSAESPVADVVTFVDDPAAGQARRDLLHSVQRAYF